MFLNVITYYSLEMIKIEQQVAELKCSTFTESKSDCKVWQRKQECPRDCPYLESNWISSWLPRYPSSRRKQNRAFQRMFTGLQIAQNNNAFMRFMTLTSPKSPKRTIKKSLDILKKRIARATVEKDGFVGFKFNRYFCLRTSEGNGVLHIVYWGRYIPQAWLSRMWNEIHGAFRVDIRACFTKRRKVDWLSGLLADELSQQTTD